MTTRYMTVNALRAARGDYTFTLNVYTPHRDLVGTVTLQAKVTVDPQLLADTDTRSPNERQVFALASEVRTRCMLSGSAAAVTVTRAADAATNPHPAPGPAALKRRVPRRCGRNSGR